MRQQQSDSTFLSSLKVLSSLKRNKASCLFEVSSKDQPGPLVLKVSPLRLEGEYAEKAVQGMTLTLPGADHPGFVPVFSTGKSGALRYILLEKMANSDASDFYLSQKEKHGLEAAQEKVVRVFSHVYKTLEQQRNSFDDYEWRMIQPSWVLVDQDGNGRLTHLVESQTRLRAKKQNSSPYFRENEGENELQQLSLSLGRMVLSVVDPEWKFDWDLNRVLESIKGQSQFLKIFMTELFQEKRLFKEALKKTNRKMEECSEKSNHDFNDCLLALSPAKMTVPERREMIDSIPAMNFDEREGKWKEKWKEEPEEELKIDLKDYIPDGSLKRDPIGKPEAFWANIKYVFKKGFSACSSLLKVATKKITDLNCSPDIKEARLRTDVLGLCAHCLLVIEEFNKQLKEDCSAHPELRDQIEEAHDRVEAGVRRKLEQKAKELERWCSSEPEEALLRRASSGRLSLNEAVKRIVQCCKGVRRRWGEAAFEFKSEAPKEAAPEGYFELLLLISFIKLYVVERNEMFKDKKTLKKSASKFTGYFDDLIRPKNPK